jgi:hypothetical protein
MTDRINSIMRNIREVYATPGWRDAVVRNAGPVSEDGLRARLERLAEPHFNVAVLGRQGVGKSSLINAMVFDREILPVDVDETTNIICRVVYGDEPAPQAIVTHLDGTKRTGPATSAFLKDFVHERFNPGNGKGVRSVDIAVRSSLLSRGAAIVDTPGVGSLLKRNEETTMAFLPTVGMAIFLISTTPALLDEEAAFLRATWEYSDRFLFVQNVWGESPDEVVTSKEHNEQHLKRIAVEQHADPAKVQILCVDVHAALEAARNRNAALCHSSGLQALLDRVGGAIPADGLLARAKDATSAIQAQVTAVRNGCALRLDALTKEQQVSDADFDRTLRELEESTARTELEWEDAKQEFRKGIEEVKQQFVTALDGEYAESQKVLYRLVDEGDVDPEKLRQATVERLSLSERKAEHTVQMPLKKHIERLQAARDKVIGAVRRIHETQLWSGSGPHVSAVARVGARVGAVLEWGGGIAVGVIALDGAFTAIAAGSVAAFPVIGLFIASAVLGIGVVIKWASKKHMRSKMKEWVSSAVSVARSNAMVAMSKGLSAASEQALELVDRDVRCALEELKSQVEAVAEDRRLRGAERGERIALLRADEALAARMLETIRQIQEQLRAEEVAHGRP